MNNREIKFRIWDTIDEKFETLLLQPTDTIGTGFIHFYPIRKIFQQFIGLKDDLGQDIYEGDIVKYSVNYTHEHGDKDIQEFIGEVKYDTTFAMYVFGANEHSMYDRIDKIEVIGNIFENADLINK